MIAGIEGRLVKLGSESCLVEVGSVTYELMLPAYCVNALSDKIGSEVRLYTMEYFEGTPGGGSFVPRMIGFLSAGEKEFFTKFISVKGIGIKKGLRCLTLPISTVAAAIEDGDEKIITSLPSLGRRMAQHIIAELKGKLKSFATGAEIAAGRERKFKAFQAETLEILIAWGEKRNEAMELIELACERHPDVKTAEELVPLVYRLKQGVEA